MWQCSWYSSRKSYIITIYIIKFPILFSQQTTIWIFPVIFFLFDRFTLFFFMLTFTEIRYEEGMCAYLNTNSRLYMELISLKILKIENISCKKYIIKFPNAMVCICLNDTFCKKNSFDINNNAFSIHVHVYSFLVFSTGTFVYDNTFTGKSDKKRNIIRWKHYFMVYIAPFSFL